MNKISPPPRYIESFTPQGKWDIHSIMFSGIPNSELDELLLYWEALPGLRETMFKLLSSNYVEFVCEDIKEYVVAYPIAAAYCSAYNSAFSSFREYLVGRLIKRYKETPPTKEEEIITDVIFSRLAVIKAIGRYEAY